MPRLSPELVTNEVFQQRTDVIVPAPEMLALPEKVLQFGTGGFLRGFADYFIDEANRQGVFEGRVVMVGSTGSERTRLLNEQGGLYTLRIQGIDAGEVIEQYHIVGSISRVLAASESWHEVLEVARSPELEVIISNTTEVGIVYNPGDFPGLDAPASFPAKLTAVLYERARTFDYDTSKGVVVLPCELIDKNGATLRDIVFRTAVAWNLDAAFLGWLESAVSICNTLVDRIVPGAPAPVEVAEIEARLRYEDAMLTTAEVYNLWAIESPQTGRHRLDFSRSNPGIILTDDVHPYKERKVRILNGGHTASVPLAFLCGEETVLSMMRNPETAAFVTGVIEKEIVPSLDVEGGAAFAKQVFERFSNPFLRHRLIDITLQSTSKWRLRLLPSLVKYVERMNKAPVYMCLGFAAYLVFMRVTEERDRVFYGEYKGKVYPIRDDQAGYFKIVWEGVDPKNKTYIDSLVSSVCAKTEFWGMNLNKLNGFVDTVSSFVFDLLNNDASRVLAKVAGKDLI